MSSSGRQKANSGGFTIIELLIATTVFSFILLLMTAGLLQIGRMYNKGVVSTRTQETARAIADDIIQSIQFSSGQVVETPSAPSPINVACFGNRRYSYRLGQPLTGGQYQLVADEATGGCNAGAGGTQPRIASEMQSPNIKLPTTPDPSPQYKGGEELLGQNMRLAKFSVKKQATSNLYDINIKVVYGSDDTLNDPALPTANCKNDRSSSQFCVVSEIVTTAQRRVL